MQILNNENSHFDERQVIELFNLDENKINTHNIFYTKYSLNIHFIKPKFPYLMQIRNLIELNFI
jgi:hypothetical protein